MYVILFILSVLLVGALIGAAIEYLDNRPGH